MKAKTVEKASRLKASDWVVTPLQAIILVPDTGLSPAEEVLGGRDVFPSGTRDTAAELLRELEAEVGEIDKLSAFDALTALSCFWLTLRDRGIPDDHKLKELVMKLVKNSMDAR